VRVVTKRYGLSESAFETLEWLNTPQKKLEELEKSELARGMDDEGAFVIASEIKAAMEKCSRGNGGILSALNKILSKYGNYNPSLEEITNLTSDEYLNTEKYDYITAYSHDEPAFRYSDGMELLQNISYYLHINPEGIVLTNIDVPVTDGIAQHISQRVVLGGFLQSIMESVIKLKNQ
jgi:hypothetical protein